jgi:hypothetical protein
MLGKRSPQRELFRPDNAMLAHVGEGSFYGFLAREGSRLFRDEDFGDLYGDRGRPSVPPSQMCILVVLQVRESVSDQEAVDRTAYDIRWKVALGVELEDKLCAKSTLQLFRANLLLNERYLQLFEASVAACRKQGLGASKKLEVAIDSTPVFGRGAVKDTYNLVSDAIRKVIEDACRLKGWDREEVIAEQGLGRHFGSSFKGESDLDWSEPEERRALLAQLVADARIALQLAKKGLQGHAKDSPKTRDLRESQALLSRILAQDIDDDPGDGGGPQIRKGTAKDRVISTTDPEMRHGHKSHSKGFDGYKASLVVDTADGVILATGVRAGNVPDRESAVELIEAAGRSMGTKAECVLGDTAYGDLGTRRKIEGLGAEVVAKAPPNSTRKGTFKRDRFRVDERRAVATCPAGKRSIRRYETKEKDGWKYVFSRKDCTPCPLRERCTTSLICARTITVTEASKSLDKLRKHQRTKTFRRRYRKRVKVEHTIGRLRRLGIRQARYFGAGKTAMQVAIAAMAANLGLLAVCLDCERVVRVLLRLSVKYIRELALLLELEAWHQPRPRMALCRPDL